MAVSSGSLDGLLNTSYPAADFTSVATKSWMGSTGIFPVKGTVSTVTLTTTGVPGPGTIPAATLKVVAVNDAVNTITLSISINGQPVSQLTERGGRPNSDRPISGRSA